MKKTINNEIEMINFGSKIGSLLNGGEIIELVGDVGSGKTTLVKGIAKGLGVKDTVQSPSFTISRLYRADNNLNLIHYDFYRLNDVGIMLDEIKESSRDNSNVIVVEWGGAVESVLPKNRINITIKAVDDEKRLLNIKTEGAESALIEEKLK